MLKEEKQASINLKLTINEQEQTIMGLQRRLGSNEDKFTIMRKSLLKSTSVESGDAFYQTMYFRELEEENNRLKEQVNKLIANQNEIEMKNFMEELKDKEFEINAGLLFLFEHCF